MMKQIPKRPTRKGYFRLFFVGCVCILPVPAYAQSASSVLDAQAVYERAKRSVVKILVTGEMDSGQVERKGTGFIVHSDKTFTAVLTAAHVIESRDKWIQNFDGSPNRKIAVSRVDDSGQVIELAQNAEVLGTNVPKVPHEDWEILVFTGSGHPTLELSTDEIGEVGSEVFLVGFPQEANVLQLLRGQTLATDIGRYSFRLPIAFGSSPDRGQSGGPIFDEDGLVVGVASRNYIIGNTQPHLAVLASRARPSVLALGSNIQNARLASCVREKVTERITRPFSIEGSARCPGGGCWPGPGSCNKRNTTLRYSSPTGYYIDRFEFVQGGRQHGGTGNLQSTRNASDQTTEISIELRCDAPNHTGAPGGWNEGTLRGMLRYADVEELRRTSEAQCRAELGL